MRFGSVCSGIEAASVAWGPLGWHAAWLAEIEPFASAVLAHHYPDVPNLGDMTALSERILAGEIEAPDVFCGGTPCQAFSIAGLRKSLGDARGNLSLTFCEIANAIDTIREGRGDKPSIVVWENVPGVLNTKDNAFGCFLAGLAGEELPLLPAGGRWTHAGCVLGSKRAIAWRVLDAQHFGLAQRRKRVFVVASARTGFDPAAVLFEFDGVRRDFAPSRETGQEPAGCLASRTDGGGFPGTDEACSGYVQPVYVCSGCGGRIDPTWGWGEWCDFCGHEQKHSDHAMRGVRGGFLECGGNPCNGSSGMPAMRRGEQSQSNYSTAVAFGGNNRSSAINVATALNACASASGRLDFDSETFLVQPVAAGADAPAPAPAIAFPARMSGTQCASTENLAPSMCASNPTAVTYGISNQPTPNVGENICPSLLAKTSGGGRMEAVAYATKLHNTTSNQAGKVYEKYATSLDRSSPPPAVFAPTGVFFAGQGAKAGSIAYSRDVSPTLKASDSGTNRTPSVHIGMAVRRLTPRECERLQGFQWRCQPDHPGAWQDEAGVWWSPDYTAIPWRTYQEAARKGASYEGLLHERGMTLRGPSREECPDGPRYKSLGNSWAIPCVAWIGERINAAIQAKEVEA